VSPSASDAVTPTLLVCASVIVPGDAVGPELMTGAVFGRGFTVTFTEPDALPPYRRSRHVHTVHRRNRHLRRSVHRRGARTRHAATRRRPGVAQRVAVRVRRRHPHAARLRVRDRAGDAVGPE